MPEFYIANFANFTKPKGGTELCFLLGSELDDGRGRGRERADPGSARALTEPQPIVVDRIRRQAARPGRAGRRKPKINGKEVTVVGTVKGLKSLAAPWVFCSLIPPDNCSGFSLPRTT